MSIISSFKKALGFPDEFDDEELETVDSEPDRNVYTSTSVRKPDDTTEAESGSESDDTKETDITSLSSNIFDAVIELFNSIQPEFIKQCLSVEAQRGYIMTHIDKTVRQRLEQELDTARSRGEKMWQKEKNRLSADLDKIKAEYNSLKLQREEFQSAQLSAARQKRALNERIHDLESKINTLEAEKEQFQLENRSMLNKLRVANVRSGSDADSETEIQRLAQENIQLQDTITELTSQIKGLNTETDSLKAKITSLEEAHTSKDDEDNAAIAEIEAQIAQFEELKKKKDAKIASLQTSLKQSSKEIENIKATLSERDATIDSLRKTIEANLISQASSEAELKAEIERLTISAHDVEIQLNKSKKQTKHNKSRTEIVEKDKPVKENPQKSEESTHHIKISAIDELMESTDWFVAPEPTPLKKDPEIEEVFGYKEPVKKTSRDDDKQLSLW